MARLLSTLSLVAIIAAAGSFLVAAGWIPWAVPVAFAALALIIAGFAFRRRRRPASPATRRKSSAGRRSRDLINNARRDSDGIRLTDDGISGQDA